MENFTFRMLFIFVFIFGLNLLRQAIMRRSRMHRVEMPAPLQRWGYRVMIPLVFFAVFLIIVGFATGDIAFTIASTVLTLVFITLVYFVRRKFKRYYTESADAFELSGTYEAFEVQYENIEDWVPLRKQIGVRDQTTDDDRYICVHFDFADPKILLTHLLEMTFAKQFEQQDEKVTDDPYRIKELVTHLEKNGYKELVQTVKQEMNLQKN